MGHALVARSFTFSSGRAGPVWYGRMGMAPVGLVEAKPVRSFSVSNKPRTVVLKIRTINLLCP
jgi:hypothetical protein